jgi:hypothetical protein
MHGWSASHDGCNDMASTTGQIPGFPCPFQAAGAEGRPGEIFPSNRNAPCHASAMRVRFETARGHGWDEQGLSFEGICTSYVSVDPNGCCRVLGICSFQDI